MTDPMDTSWAQPEGTPAGAPDGRTPLVTPKKAKSGGLMNALLLVGAVIAVGGIAFAAGRMTAPTSTRGQFGNGQFPGGPGGSFTPGQGGFGGFGGADRAVTVSGTVKSNDGTTLVLTTASGQEMSISLSGTTYHSQAAATAADVKAGATVAVEVSGLGGFRGDPGASGAPAASRAPGQGTITAKDVTVIPGQ